MKDSRSLSKILSIAGIGLCGLCCALPLVGIIAGAAFVSAAVAFLETIAITLILASAVVFSIYYFKKRSTRTCDINCKHGEVHRKQSDTIARIQNPGT
jgi:purine-cytosine permease-like protein